MGTITGKEEFWGAVKLSDQDLAYINDSPTMVKDLLQYQQDFNNKIVNSMKVGSGGGTLFNGSYVEFASDYAQWIHRRLSDSLLTKSGITLIRQLIRHLQMSIRFRRTIQTLISLMP
jgi:hypothetical protein